MSCEKVIMCVIELLPRDSIVALLSSFHASVSPKLQGKGTFSHATVFHLA